LDPLISALLKGVLEGLTEFLPISSTGHLVLVREYLPLTTDPAQVDRVNNLFDIVVQLPAVLAIVVLYRQRLWQAALRARDDAAARNFWVGLFIAFLPIALVGLALNKQIERLLNSHGLENKVIAVALIVGGLILILVERKSDANAIQRAEDVPLSRALGVGLCQCLALIPGTSRSGATIVGGRFLGLSREAAAEYSFFLAVPVMVCACGYKMLKGLDSIQWSTDGPVLLVGSIAAFATAWMVVAIFVRFIQKHTLGVFGWYRIALGLVVLYFARG
jgi:undecaprenyl-diphosphatase